jgi:hypothetical protein
MSESLPTEFLLPPSFSVETMVTSGRLDAVSESRVRLTLLDTFDRRLLKAGVWLAIEKNEDGLCRCVCQFGQGPREVLPWQGSLPVFSNDLTRLDSYARLAPILNVRALMPQMEIAGTCSEWVVEVDDGIAVLTFRVESLAVKEKRRSSPLQPRLRLIPVKGHRKEFRALAESLCAEPKIQTAEATIYQAAVDTLSNAWPVTVIPPAIIDDPELRADVAVKRVLRQLLETIRINQPGLLAKVDTEFLHDYRVAVRRTRAVLGQMGATLPPRLLQRFRDGFADLAQATNGARDLSAGLGVAGCTIAGGDAGPAATVARRGDEPVSPCTSVVECATQLHFSSSISGRLGVFSRTSPSSPTHGEKSWRAHSRSGRCENMEALSSAAERGQGHRPGEPTPGTAHAAKDGQEAALSDGTVSGAFPCR